MLIKRCASSMRRRDTPVAGRNTSVEVVPSVIRWLDRGNRRPPTLLHRTLAHRKQTKTAAGFGVHRKKSRRGMGTVLRILHHTTGRTSPSAPRTSDVRPAESFALDVIALPGNKNQGNIHKRKTNDGHLLVSYEPKSVGGRRFPRSNQRMTLGTTSTEVFRPATGVSRLRIDEAHLLISIINLLRRQRSCNGWQKKNTFYKEAGGGLTKKRRSYYKILCCEDFKRSQSTRKPATARMTTRSGDTTRKRRPFDRLPRTDATSSTETASFMKNVGRDDMAFTSNRLERQLDDYQPSGAGAGSARAFCCMRHIPHRHGKLIERTKENTEQHSFSAHDYAEGHRQCGRAQLCLERMYTMVQASTVLHQPAGTGNTRHIHHHLALHLDLEPGVKNHILCTLPELYCDFNDIILETINFQIDAEKLEYSL
ncbi:hypothetical protein OSTOST_02947 [Ostertagia ostertagi]